MTVTYNTLITPSYIYLSDGGVFSANKTATAVFDYFPDDAAVDDALYFGHSTRFDDIVVYIGTPFAATSVTFVWEYYNSSSVWSTLTVTDPTSGWIATGSQTIAFVPPIDWRYTTINSVSAWWIRCRISAVDTPTEGGANSTSAVQVGDNKVIVTGGTEGSPITWANIYAAAPSVVTQVSAYHYQYNCYIDNGNGSTTTWFTDTKKIIEGMHDWACITLYANANFRAGTLVNEANKITRDGCTFLIRMSSWSRQFFLAAASNYQFYSCHFDNQTGYSGGLGDYSYGVGAIGKRVWNCSFNNVQFNVCHGINAYNVNIGNCYYLIALSWNPTPATFDKFFINGSSSDPAVSFGYGATLKNSEIYVGASSAIGECVNIGIVYVLYLIDCNADNWRFKWNGSHSGCYYLRQYTFNLLVTDQDGNAISDATVTLKDISDNTVFSVSTAVDGTITEQTVTYKKYISDGTVGWHTNSTITDYGPHTLTITKSGYADYEDVITIDEKKDLKISLSLPGNVSSTNYSLAPIGVKSLIT